MSPISDSQKMESGTEVEAVPPAKPSLFEAVFQASLEGLLILLYMSAAMVFVADLMGGQFRLWMWAIQGVGFAVFVVIGRAWMSLRGHKRLEDDLKLKRLRWTMFVMAGVVVAVACGTKVLVGGATTRTAAGLGVIAIVMAIAGVIGFARTPRVARDRAGK